jgi:hypothetical protein
LATTRKTRKLPYTGIRSCVMTDSFNSPRPGVSYSTKTKINNSSVFNSFDGTQVTESENHPAWRSRHFGDFVGDLGGEFSSKRQYVESGNPQYVAMTGVSPPEFDKSFTVNSYSGPFLPLTPALCQFPAYADSSDSDLIAWGTKAIAQASPVNPTSNVSTFLGEFLQEGVPHTIGAALKGLSKINPKSVSKALAGEHLNIQFGWLPFVSDLRSMIASIRHAGSILDQLDRDSGKVVRRGWKFKPDLSNDITAVTGEQGPWTLTYSSLWYSSLLDPKSKVYRESQISRSRWFKGAFVYYVPPPSPNGLTTNAIARRLLQAEKVLGIEPTPDAVWNLMPWSWLVDWFSNAGDYLSNLDAMILDNQVLLYGYMMEHTVSKYTYTLVGDYYLRDGSIGPVPPSVAMVSETKRRIKATPYGFGLTYGGLSAMQKSILAALGLNKGIRH